MRWSSTRSIVLLSQSVPGALGLALRKKSVSAAARRAAGATWSSGRTSSSAIRTRFTSAITWSSTTTASIDAKGESNAGIRIASGVFIGRNTILSCKNGDIDLGEGANVGFNCEIFSASRVRIGRNALIAAYCYLIGGDHDFSDASRPVLEQARKSAGITVGDGAWLGAGAKVLDGVEIGANAVIGAGAVVRESVPERATAVGVPARVVDAR